MKMVTITLLFFFVAEIILCDAGFSTLNKYDHFVKKLSFDIFPGGRLTSRQITSLADGSFKSVLSIVEFPTDDEIYNGVVGSFPSTKNELAQVASMNLVPAVYNAALTVNDVIAVSTLLESLPKPVFIHCHVRTCTSFSVIGGEWLTPKLLL